MNHPLHKGERVSIGKGLLICKLFFYRLWPLIEPKLPPKNLETMTYEMHEIFCSTVCRGERASVEWIEAVHRVKQFSKEQQENAQLSLEDLFSCMVEFCKIYDKRYDSELDFLLQLLASMKQSPEQYLAEWKVFKEAITDGLARCYSPGLTYTPYLNWDTKFSEPYILSVEEGFAVCASFFMNLWLILDPTDSLVEVEPYGTYYLFCQIECGEGISGPAPSGHAEWNEIVFRVKHVPKDQQKTLKLTTDEVLLCMLEFCKLYNKKYKLWGVQHNDESNLFLIIDILNSVQKNTKENKSARVLFQDSIASVINGFYSHFSFDWDDIFDKHRYNE